MQNLIRAATSCGSEMGIFQQNVHKEEKNQVPLAESTFLLLRLDVKIDDSVIEQVSSHKIFRSSYR